MKKILNIFLLTFSLINSSYLEFMWNKGSSFELTEKFIRMTQNLFNTQIFIESGTFLGNTVKNTCNYFESIYSVELSPELYQKAIERFKNNKHVSILEGSSDIVFTKLFPTLNKNKRITFWLDGHYSGGSTALGTKTTPIVEELIAIKNAGITNSIIMVDDIRCFVFRDNDFPTVPGLKQLILDINPAYQFYIYGDTAIACLPEDNITPSSLVKMMTAIYLNEDLSSLEPIYVTSQEASELNKIQSIFKLFPGLENKLIIKD